MTVKDIKNINDVKKELSKLWGAVTTFQSQLYSINGDVQETRSLVEDVSADINSLITLTEEIKKSVNGEDNNLLEVTTEIDKYRKEVNKE